MSCEVTEFKNYILSRTVFFFFFFSGRVSEVIWCHEYYGKASSICEDFKFFNYCHSPIDLFLKNYRSYSKFF